LKLKKKTKQNFYMPRYSWNIAKVDDKIQSINQSNFYFLISDIFSVLI